jgi:hypothetical protein
VNTPEIGSRDGVLCFGGILRFCADFRRESFWGNLSLMVFGFMGGVPRRYVEEGGQLVCFLGELGAFWGNLGLFGGI